MTYNELVSSAMRAIRVTQAGENPTAGEYAVGIERLNNMVSGWRNMGLQIDYSNIEAADGGNTVGFDEEDIGAITSSLSVELCDDYGKEPTPALLKRAYIGYSGLYVKWYSGPSMRVDDALTPAQWPGTRNRGASSILNG